MEITQFDLYGDVVAKAARKVGFRPEQLDGLGRDADDYAADLALTSLEVQLNFRRRHGFFPADEERYVQGALWRRSTYLRRGAYTAPELEELTGVEEPVCDGVAQAEARDALHRLHKQLGEQMDILCRVAESGGIRAAYDPEKDGKPSTFRYRVKKLRERAAEILSSVQPKTVLA